MIYYHYYEIFVFSRYSLNMLFYIAQSFELCVGNFQVKIQIGLIPVFNGCYHRPPPV